MLFGVVTLGVYNKEGEEREAFAAAKEAERRDRYAQEELRREYGAWLARMGRYGGE
jgi:hypothetical protein